VSRSAPEAIISSGLIPKLLHIYLDMGGMKTVCGTEVELGHSFTRHHLLLVFHPFAQDLPMGDYVL